MSKVKIITRKKYVENVPDELGRKLKPWQCLFIQFATLFVKVVSIIRQESNLG